MDALIVDKAVPGLTAFVSHTTELQVTCGYLGPGATNINCAERLWGAY
jgi:hypothetical protein